MQRRTPSPNTQSGASAKSRAVIYVLSKPFFGFYARVSYKQRRSKTRTPTRHRRIITPRSGLGTVSVRLVFWKAEIQARTSVPLSGTCRSRRERPVRVLHGAFHTTRTTGMWDYKNYSELSNALGGLSAALGGLSQLFFGLWGGYLRLAMTPS